MVDNFIRRILDNGGLKRLNLFHLGGIQGSKNRNGSNTTGRAMTFGLLVWHAHYPWEILLVIYNIPML
ncbi:hypothetical protein [Thiothrix subterranea]|uniref:hypothetical protein n=1 Tax=Thiothrix subterranea TaxID=2735563 RepID=UPI001D198959|nr:hypothetical protein [Thiothrix subterranea]